MHDQTLRLMNHGYVPTEIANRIDFPPSLARLWHLRGYYGTLKHNVQGIYAYYLGWYDGNPANLDALPPREKARRTLQYMGGIDAVMTKAREDFATGDYRWVVHILDQVMWVVPEHSEARELAAAAHTQLGYGAENATWRNAYLSAAQELRHGLPQGGKNHRVLRDVLKGMSALLLLNSLSIRLNGTQAIGKALTINWKVTDTQENCHSELTNAVLINREGESADAQTTVFLSRSVFSRLALGEIGFAELAVNGVRFKGDAAQVANLLAMMDQFPAWFPIASHGLKYEEAQFYDADYTDLGGR
jgi:alkyl sulfatase BDS1-like metallo-beta-lactamase superfamily hydrolase